MLPKLTFLGTSLDEALNLQKQHEELLLNIQVSNDGSSGDKSTAGHNYWFRFRIFRRRSKSFIARFRRRLQPTSDRTRD